ncbi:hypothetical protein DL768_011267 [Monosporascus sp. mg162]|nr:hypothetical protein DL768_011267 [Monosporascus sp. mg162]
MSTGNLQRNAYNRRRPRREPTLASASSSPPGIANGPPTKLVEGGVYILISTRDRNYHDPDNEAPLRSSSSRHSVERGHETSRQADTEPGFTWSLYLQRTPHLGTLYRPGEPARGVFSIVPRPRTRVPVTTSSSSPGPHQRHHHHRLIVLVQVDRVTDAAAMDRAAASTTTADGQLHRRARPHLDTAADERAWALAVLRALRTTRGQCRTATTESEPESDLLAAADGWAGRVARGAMGVDAVAAPVAFWWRRDWRWEVPARVPRDWRDLAYRRYSCDTT